MADLSRLTSPSLSESDNLFPSQNTAWNPTEYAKLEWIPESKHSNLRACLSRFPRETIRVAFVLSIAFLAFTVGIIYLQFTPARDQSAGWIAYSTTGSQGPLLQLRIENSNTSEWVFDHSGHRDSFAFRVDDQTLIPRELLSNQEIHYQAWFQKFYPQLWEVYRDGQYLDGDYLAAASSNMIRVDLRFHLSHCVLALRRYWDAKESGKHICARDLDPGHIEHCLNSLDEWAFPADGVPPKHNVYLEWITQVCEYDQ